MSDASPRTPDIERIQRLLGSLAGVASARVVAGADGRLLEIHVVSEPALHAKQVVRNVESALNAAFALNIDRRIISVAELTAEPAATPAEVPASLARSPQPNGAAGAPAAAAAPGAAPESATDAESVDTQDARFIFRTYETRGRAARDVVCRVVLADAAAEHSGEGHGLDTPQGRAQAGARALFNALAVARGNRNIVLEGVSLLDAHGRTYVLVAARGLEDRTPMPLVGLAPLGRSPEEAAIFASLQATNRWTARSDF